MSAHASGLRAPRCCNWPPAKCATWPSAWPCLAHRRRSRQNRYAFTCATAMIQTMRSAPRAPLSPRANVEGGRLDTAQAVQRRATEPAKVPSDRMKRYEKLAEEIAALIRSGVLAPGAKVPSVRHASRTYGISPSAVLEPFCLLESRGLITPRPRSGFFARDQAQRPLHEPQQRSH